ncbi:MAG: cupin domain-containing protein [Deltaproteobacteria bacterium]|nr:cupin domain-containing protein [Deltaproteobacteria bacterium]
MASDDHRSELEERGEFKKLHTYRGLVFRNLKHHPVHPRASRGKAIAYFEFEDNHSLDAHIDEIPPGGCSGKHRHNNEAVIYIVQGQGYSILQKEGEPEIKVEWKEGDLFSPPLLAWHQHFNTDQERPARFLAVTMVPFVKALGILTIEKAGS